jgi:prophage tail gpP-like protein
MAKRPTRDEVTIASADGGDASILIDRATQFEIATDLLSPSAARFELGDDGTWEALRPYTSIGSRMVVSVNGYARLVGRLLTRNLAVSAGSGGTVQVVVRTRLADAMFTAVDPKIGVKNTTIFDIIIAAFKQMGLTQADFLFDANVAREVLTGRTSSMKPAPEVRSLTEEEARPHPPETIYGFVDRHLSRFGLMMWDAPDGRIIIGAPDDTQNPLYLMACLKGNAARANNLLSATKTEDFEEVPRDLWIFGVGGGRDQQRARVKFVATDSTLFALNQKSGFGDRTAFVIDESIRTQAQAEARARREMMRRSLQKDTWVLETDGFGYWSGSEEYPYMVDVVADVQIDIAGAASGPYLAYQCLMRGNAQDGMTTRLTVAGKGIWVL